METNQIRQSVQDEITKWTNLQSRNDVRVNFSKRAINFIVEVVENIELDPSENWRKQDNFNYNSAQEFAISLIPNALNDVSKYKNWKYQKKKEKITITSWEIWQSLSEIIRIWCFIPKNDL